MFRSTSDYACFAKLVAIFFVGANLMTTALKVQSSAVYGYHGPVSDFSLLMPVSNLSNKHRLYEPVSDFSLFMASMSNISNKYRLYSSSDFSTLFDFEVNASRHVYSPWCT